MARAAPTDLPNPPKPYPGPVPETSRRVALLASLTLLLVTACWGSTFFLIKDLLDRVPAVDFLAVRFLIAGVFLTVLFPRALGRLERDSWRHAAVLGAVYGTGQVLQTVGLAHTPASVSGFITGMYVVCTPLLAAVLLKTRIGPLTWAAVLLATAGLAVLTLDGFSVGYGEGLTFVAAVLYALHIVGLGAWARKDQALGMSIVQLFMVSALCFGAAAPGGIELATTTRDWLSILYMAFFAAGLAMLGQTWAQAHLSPTRTAIIMSTEPVFAALFAVLLGGESVAGRMAVGGAMVLAAMLMVELAPRRRIEAEVQHLTV